MKKRDLIIGAIGLASGAAITIFGMSTLNTTPKPSSTPPREENVPEESPTALPSPTPEDAPGAGEVDPSPTPEDEKPGKGKERDNPFAPVSADKKWVSSKAYLEFSEVVVKNKKVSLALAGSLPTPCHKLRVLIPDPNEDNQIQVEVYSVANPDEVCVQVLAPFEAEIALDAFEEGEYTVWVNGEEIGDFQGPNK